MKKKVLLITVLLVLTMFLILVPGCSTSSDDGGTSNQSTATIGAEGGSISLESAGGSPVVEFPPGALLGTAKVTLTDMEDSTDFPNTGVLPYHPFKMDIEGAQISGSGYVNVKFSKTPQSGHIPAVGHYMNGKHTVHPATDTDGIITGKVMLMADPQDGKRSGTYSAEMTALDIPVVYESSGDPPMSVYRLENNQWVEDETGWTGDKIAMMVHGINGSKEDLLALAIHMNQKGTYDNIYAVQYELGYHIDSLGSKLATIIQTNLPSGSSFNILAHSMGGLVIRSAIENHGVDTLTSKAVMMGSPQSGVFAAFLLTLIGKGIIPKFVPEIGDLSPDSDFLKNLNNGVPVNVKYYTAVGTNGENLTEYWTIKDLGETIVKILLGYPTVDGMVPANSAGYDLTAECSAWETAQFPVSHQYIRGGDYGTTEIYEDVLNQVDTWIAEN